ncbi:MAG: hypothetical protein QOG64_1486 [Acidimicrobiaceae bacterium]|jgi:hypothetical protein|nr:hypothetical protein [Acidimicrobiaceae bacterium]
MAKAPFPSIHTGANRSAADKAERARAARDRADQLLDEIDAMLGLPRRDS